MHKLLSFFLVLHILKGNAQVGLQSPAKPHPFKQKGGGGSGGIKLRNDDPLAWKLNRNILPTLYQLTLTPVLQADQEEVMDTWTLQTGFPLLSLTSNGDTFSLKQEKFGNIDSLDLWSIPVSIATKEMPNFDPAPEHWLLEKELKDLTKGSGWILGNAGATAYYRVQYYPENEQLLEDQLLEDHEVIGHLNRAQLLNDYFAFAWLVLVPINRTLGFTKYLSLGEKAEDNYIVWGTVLKELGKTLNLFGSAGLTEQLQAYLLPGLEKAILANGGFQVIGNLEGKGTPVLRQKLLVDWACALGHEACEETSLEFVDMWMKNLADGEKLNPIHRDYRPVIYCAANKASESPFFSFFWELYKNGEAEVVTTKQKGTILNSLACTGEDEHITMLLEGSLEEGFYNDKSHGITVLRQLAGNVKARQHLMAFLDSQFDELVAFHGNQAPITQSIQALSTYMSTQEELNQVETFITSHVDEIGDSLNIYVQAISNNIQWISDFGDDISKFFIDNALQDPASEPTSNTTTEETPSELTTEVISSETTTKNTPINKTTEVIPSETTTEVIPSETTTEVIPSETTTEVIPSELTTEEVPSETTTENTPINKTTEVIPSETTTEVIPSETTTEVIPSETTTTTTNTPIPSCKMCQSIELNGRRWSACVGQNATKDCNETVASASGQVFWECSKRAEFKTSQPDYSNCVSQWLNDLKEEQENVTDSASAIDYLTKLEDSMGSNNVNSSSNYFGHEIPKITDILSNVAQTASNSTTNSEKFLPVAKKTVELTQFIISVKDPWYHLELANRSHYATKLVKTIEETSFLLTAKVNESKVYEVPLAVSQEQFLAVSMTGSKFQPEFNSLQFPSELTQYSKDSIIKFPQGWTETLNGEKIECVGIIMDSEYASLMMPGQFQKLGLNSTEENKTIMNGKLMTFTVSSKNKEIQFPGQGVQITFKHEIDTWGTEGSYNIPRKLHFGESPKAAQGSAQCVYWNTNTLKWSPEGCGLISITKTETICECNHLTSFAILMDVHNYIGKNLGLEVLTIILCSLSIICLIVTIFIFLTIRMCKSERTSITLNLAFCLLIGNVIVILVLDRNYFHMSDSFCIASGIVTHYVFLASFGWMFVQGIHLYNMVINIFIQFKSPLNMYKVGAYGLPFIPIAITAMAGYLSGNDPYGGEVVCWLNNNYIWAFILPIFLIVLTNLVILSICMWKIYHNKNNPLSYVSKKRVSYLRFWINGCFGLTILLGITWLFGFLMLAPEIPGLVASYLFTVLNASQGIFIFIFHCIMNDKVRQGIYHQHGSRFPKWINEFLKSSPPTTTDQSYENNRPKINAETESSENLSGISDGRNNNPVLYPVLQNDESSTPDFIPSPVFRRMNSLKSDFVDGKESKLNFPKKGSSNVEDYQTVVLRPKPDFKQNRELGSHC